SSCCILRTVFWLTYMKTIPFVYLSHGLSTLIFCVSSLLCTRLSLRIAALCAPDWYRYFSSSVSAASPGTVSRRYESSRATNGRKAVAAPLRSSVIMSSVITLQNSCMLLFPDEETNASMHTESDWVIG